MYWKAFFSTFGERTKERLEKNEGDCIFQYFLLCCYIWTDWKYWSVFKSIELYCKRIFSRNSPLGIDPIIRLIMPDFYWLWFLEICLIGISCKYLFQKCNIAHINNHSPTLHSLNRDKIHEKERSFTYSCIWYAFENPKIEWNLWTFRHVHCTM